MAFNWSLLTFTWKLIINNAQIRAFCIQYFTVAVIGKDRLIPIHFSRSMNSELTLLCSSDSRFARVLSSLWCCASASCSFLCNVSRESWMSWTSETNLENKERQLVDHRLILMVSYLIWTLSRHSSIFFRCDLASSLVWATFMGLLLSIMALFKNSMCLSRSNISCWT